MATRPILFGNIDGIEESHDFAGRKEMMPSSFHRNWGAGIDGNPHDGVAAIVLSDGYEDDEDEGDVIIYTGAGGKDKNSNKQIADQTWENSGNGGLRVSMDKGLPVRVIRGHQHQSAWSPASGYRYGGLYAVVDAWQEKGKSGFLICRFRLEYCGSGENYDNLNQDNHPKGNKSPSRSASMVVRVIRDTQIARWVKRLYEFKCQVCGTAIPTQTGLYAEGAHIRPLGKPHNGADNTENILCLCPNHHIMLDKGSFAINDDLTLIGCVSGSLQLNDNHKIEISNLAYHRDCHGIKT